MEILAARPPNFDAIVAKFPFARNEGISFSWGLNAEGKPRIYCPSAEQIPPLHGVIKAHENVHCQRQGKDEGAIRAWWERYLVDDLFRFEEEVLGHRAELRAWKTYERDPRKLERWKHDIAAKLAGPLYGNLVTPEFARRMLVVEVDHVKVRRMLREGAHA